MNWYRNLKIRSRFIVTFAVILISFLLAGYLGFSTIFKITNSFSKNITSNQEVVLESASVINNIVQIRVDALNINGSSGNIDVNAAKEKLNKSLNSALEELEAYLDKVRLAAEGTKGDVLAKYEEQLKLGEYLSSFSTKYVEKNCDYFAALNAGNTALVKSLDEEITKIGNDLFEYLFYLPKIAFEAITLQSESIKNSSIFNIILTLIIFLISITVSATLASILSITTRKPIDKLSKDSKTVAKGDLNVSIRMNTKDELGDLSNAVADMADVIKAILEDIKTLSFELSKGNCSYLIDSSKYTGVFKEVTEAINSATKVLIEDTLYTIDRIQEFSKGDFSQEIKRFPGEKEAIKIGLDSVKNSLQLVSGDITDLVRAASEGNLEFKLDTEKYSGQWKETCNGLNSFVYNVVVPIKETQNALNQFAKGNFAHRITNEYKGEFNEIKKTVNFTAETIGHYISEISETLTKMANKDFNVSIDNEYLGDFKEIQNSVNNIVANLNILVKDIISSAEQVNAGAKQISESSISLAEGATEQAEAVENLTNTVKLISEQAVTNAKNSEKANDLALHTKENAASGSEQMNNMLTAMEDINNSSNSISNIIKVIDDIAFQTNILALNAAVEAARAGEHGKGFAVVAEEVRSLAARSQEAAKETTELIQSSVDKVEEGSKIANSTAESLLSIVNQIEEISSLVNSCALSSKEQEKSIEEMTIGINQIKNVTQDNTATSEESAAASEELASQSEVFYTSVSDFKLKENMSNTSINNTKSSSISYGDIDLNPLSDAAITISDDSNFGKY